MLTRTGLARRKLLKSCAYNSLLFFPLMRMFRDAEARADTVSPSLAIFGYWPTGHVPSFWPKNESGPITDFGPVLKPIDELGLKDQFVLLNNLKLYGSYDHNGGLTQSLAGWGGAGLVDKIGVYLSGASEIHGMRGNGCTLADLSPRPYSLDQMLAKRWNVEPLLLGTGTRKVLFDTGLSWTESGVQTFSEDNPKVNFDRLMKNFNPGGGSTSNSDAAIKVAKSEKRMIDYLRGDLNRINSSLGGQDKDQFNAHLEGLNQIDAEIQKAVMGNNTKAVATCGIQTVGDSLKLTGEWYYDQNNIPMVMNLNRSLLVQAVACGITRVALYQIGAGHCNLELQSEGVARIGKDFHSISHEYADQYIKIQSGHIRQIAKIATELKAIKVGTGTLFDNAMIMGMSDSGVTGHVPGDIPAFYLGGKIKAGREIQLPTGTPYNNALVKMAQLVGENVDYVGNKTKAGLGPLANEAII